MWEGVANRYWHLPVYFVPTCVMAGAVSNERQQEQPQQGQQPAGEQEGVAAAADAGVK